MPNGRENLSSIWEEFVKRVLNMTHTSIDREPFIIISFIYRFTWTNEIVYCRNIGLSYEVNDTRLSPFRYKSMPIEAITPIWYMVVAMVGHIVPVTYWWSCVSYSGLLKFGKSVTGSSFSRLGRFNRGRKSAKRGCGRQHRECSRVDRISGRTNGRGKRTMSESNTSVVPVSYSCRTKTVLAVLNRQRSGVKATIWWFCHDHKRSGRSAMIGNIGKEWSAQCDLGLMAAGPSWRRLLCFHISSTTVDTSLSYCLNQVCTKRELKYCNKYNMC